MKRPAGTAVLLLLISLCLGQPPPPPPPQISNTFVADTWTSVTTGNRNGTKTVLTGSGVRQYDERGKRTMTNVSLVIDRENHVYEKHFNLQRYDIGKQYLIIGLTNTTLTCNANNVSGDLPDFFGWLKNSVYNGSRIYRGRVLTFWASTVDMVDLEVGVDLTKDENIPVVYYHRHQKMDKESEIYFTSFEPREPPEWAFDIPSLCREGTN